MAQIKEYTLRTHYVTLKCVEVAYMTIEYVKLCYRILPLHLGHTKGLWETRNLIPY